MFIKKQLFSVLSNGEKVYLFTVKNSRMSFSVTNYGCIITSIVVPSAIDSQRKGEKDDIVLGYSTFENYIHGAHSYFGSIVGRYANRIGNAKFSLNRKTYTLDANNGKHSLHGGFNGYNRMLWDAKMIYTLNEAGVCFTRRSIDGEQGFPGNVDLQVSYVLTHDSKLIMKYTAKTDAETPINLTNHSYFNLTGNPRNDITEHTLMINADQYLAVTKDLIPNGKIENVSKKALDFRTFKPIGKDIETIGGYDHCYVLNNKDDLVHLCAEVREPTTKRVMTVHTNQPGVQFYSGNFLNIPSGKNGVPYAKHSGFCLETQRFPDSPNHANFPSSLLKVGDEYVSTTIYKFGVY